MEPELHIAGIVVFADQSHLESVASCIGAIPMATIHAATPDGKMVVTLEADSTQRTLDYLDAIRALPGVMNVAMVYQHAEPLAALEQEME